MSQSRSKPAVNCLAALTGLILCGALHAQQHNALTAQEQAQGWQLLFDGHSLHGWHSYHAQAPGKDWQVSDGAILLEKRPNDPAADFQDLVTDAEFGDFDLKLSWKMSPCADSGVMFHVHEAPQYANTYETGPEMQIADLACTKPDSRVLKERSGDLFDLISSDVEWVNEAGQWNDFEIIAKQGHVQFFQNGHKAIDTQLWTDGWKRLVDQSKFAAWPGFASFHSGHVSLQGTEDKGDVPIRLWFRDIKLRKL